MTTTTTPDEGRFCFYCGEPLDDEEPYIFAHAGWVHWTHIHAGEVEL